MLHLGTSGFSFADWRGTFYPEKISKADMLAFYAARFGAVELNFSYYTMPLYRTIQGIADKVDEGFHFSVKAHRSMTHEIPESEGDRRNAFIAFISGIEPLVHQGKLGCVLVQFPWAFKPSSQSHDYLGFVSEMLSEIPAVVEFRNSLWVERGEVRQRSLQLLKSLGLGYCCVDEPNLKGLMPPLATATSPIGYIRFHGRNAKTWWNHETVQERYDYSYSREELEGWLVKIEAIAERTEDVFVFFNNCSRGQAANNAILMAGLLEGL